MIFIRAILQHCIQLIRINNVGIKSRTNYAEKTNQNTIDRFIIIAVGKLLGFCL